MLNKKLLLKVKERILADPKHFDMEQIAFEDGKPVGLNGDLNISGPNKHEGCGTVCCIAGWAWLLNKRKIPKTLKGRWNKFQIKDIVSTLGFEDDSLFYVEYWDHEYRKNYTEAKTPKARAKVAADYIDYLIEEDGEGE